MSLRHKFSSSAIDKVFVGTTEIGKGYLGSTRLWYYKTVAPIVESVTRGNNNTGTGTTKNVTLPATVNADDILIVIICNNGTTTPTWDNSTAGTWTNLFSASSTTGNRLTAYWKVADGTEDGKVLGIGLGATVRCAWHIYRISGGETVSCGTAALGNTASTAPNPPSLTPSWGSDKTLWIPTFGCLNQTADGGSFAYPANYGTNGIYDEAANAAGCGIGSSYRVNEAASEDPAAWTINASLKWVANTIAVQPEAVEVVASGSLSFRAAANSAGGTSDITIDKPTGTVSGDLMIAYIFLGDHAVDTVSFTPPSGWTQIDFSSQGVTYGLSIGTYYKVAGGSEGASYSWTSNTGGYMGGFIATYSGQNVSPIGVHELEFGNSGTAVSSSLTTTDDGSILIHVNCSYSGGEQTPSGFTERSRLEFDLGALFDKTQATAGATGAVSSTLDGSERWASTLIAIKPS